MLRGIFLFYFVMVGFVFSSVNVNFFYEKNDVPKIEFRYKDGSQIKTSTKKMNSSGGKWWSTNINESSIEFQFLTNNSQSNYNLGKATSPYYKSKKNQFFSVNTNKVWVKDRLLFSYNPDNSNRDKLLKVMTLNLHTYQEYNQEEKFDKIAEAITKLDLDVILFQEVGENWNSGNGDWDTNMAKIINDKTGNKYNIYFDWSHKGFEKYREGSAILSKYDFVKTDSKFVSTFNSTFSRKIVMGQINVPNYGKVNLFSVHTNWYEKGLQDEIDNLKAWTNELNEGVKGTIICGDFNANAGSNGYDYIFDDEQYIDQYYLANPDGFNDATIGKSKRIDYIITHNEDDLEVILAQRVFTEKCFGRVSDHNGQYAEFKLINTNDNKDYDKWFFRGTSNRWGLTELDTLDGVNYSKEIKFDGESFSPRFKIDRFGNWQENYPENDFPVEDKTTYLIKFNSTTKEIEAIPVKKHYDKFYFRGTSNNWSTSEMTTTDGISYFINVQFNGEDSSARFKIDRFGDWQESYPTNDYIVDDYKSYKILFNKDKKIIDIIEE